MAITWTAITTAKDFEAAIENFGTYALDSFNQALVEAKEAEPPADAPGISEEQKAKNQANRAKWATDVAKAKSQMASALQQLVQADTMLSEKKGRDGYKTLVALMVNTKDAAEKVNDKVKDLAPKLADGTAAEQQARIQQINTLATVLTALARIAPVPVWQKDPPASGAG